jgi:hypothetical protein
MFCSDIPPPLARFLGDVSGLAEFVGDKVSQEVLDEDTESKYIQIMFCRHTSCWRLDLRKNVWERAASLKVRRKSLQDVSWILSCLV